ncbi:MAG: methyltransferase [Bdellovibrionota bacterium]
MTLIPTNSSIETGSFRDRSNQVFYENGAVRRALSTQGLADWEALQRTSFFRTALTDGEIVDTKRVHEAPSPPGPWVAVLEHAQIPFISYPYEWSFSMLRDAGCQQLRLLEKALGEGLILKDGSSFNSQFVGARPAFIDIGSFTRYERGRLWEGYRQFCQMFLFPLLLTAYARVPFQLLCRSFPDGISALHCRRLLGARALLRRGVLKHVVLQSVLERQLGNTEIGLRSELENSPVDATLVKSTVRSLASVLEKLAYPAERTTWSHYKCDESYAPEDLDRKRDFVRRIACSRRRSLTFDIGANTGEFARIAAECSDYVVALDGDEHAIERLYRKLAEEKSSSILPLVFDATNPTPASGWRLRERKSLEQRGRPDLVLFLAIVHHLVITNSVPVTEVLDWLRELNGEIVFELVTKEDPQAQKLLRNRSDQQADYTREHVEAAMRERFHIADQLELGGGRRVLYALAPK